MFQVVIVDDEPYIRQGLQIIINWREYGFEICGEASNGKEAIDLLIQKKVDLIITDIKMPDMNGLELMEYIWKHISKDIRCILLSGYYEFEYAKKAIKYEAINYILKPVEQEELICALDDFKKQYSTRNQIYDNTSMELENNKYHMDKELMDQLIKVIEEYNFKLMEVKINKVFHYLKDEVEDPELIKINMDYLLFNLINLIKKLHPNVKQEELDKLIWKSEFHLITEKKKLSRFRTLVIYFADYINQLRQYAFGGVLSEIDREIRENYKESLSLKSLSEKYFINSAYLGQIFKKQYGISFKDYLSSFRIERAAELLLRSDVMIYEIANEVGFNSTDYFISKFVEIKGVTPLQYRKQTIKR